MRKLGVFEPEPKVGRKSFHDPPNAEEKLLVKLFLNDGMPEKMLDTPAALSNELNTSPPVERFGRNDDKFMSGIASPSLGNALFRSNPSNSPNYFSRFPLSELFVFLSYWSCQYFLFLSLRSTVSTIVLSTPDGTREAVGVGVTAGFPPNSPSSCCAQ